MEIFQKKIMCFLVLLKNNYISYIFFHPFLIHLWCMWNYTVDPQPNQPPLVLPDIPVLQVPEIHLGYDIPETDVICILSFDFERTPETCRAHYIWYLLFLINLYCWVSWYSTFLSKVFQLYRDDLFYWWRKLYYMENIANIVQVPVKQSDNAVSCTPRVTGCCLMPSWKLVSYMKQETKLPSMMY
jgi:hypothetical protein